jgi:hypothetical protein
MPLAVAPGESALVWISTEHDPKTGEHYEVGFNQVFVEPSTAEILGKREWGAFSVAKQDLIPFIYVLHYSLHIPSSVGLWIMGVVAIVWIFDCFIGAYLTFPRGRPFLAKWKPSWLIKFGASGHRIVFDLHRAVGLWLWGLLLAIAVSAVYLNLPQQVFLPVVGAVATLTPEPEDGRNERETLLKPRVGFEDAIARAEEEGKRLGWSEKPAWVGWDHEHGLYYVEYQEQQYRSGPGLGSSFFYIDDMTGAVEGRKIAGEARRATFSCSCNSRCIAARSRASPAASSSASPAFSSRCSRSPACSSGRAGGGQRAKSHSPPRACASDRYRRTAFCRSSRGASRSVLPAAAWARFHPRDRRYHARLRA